MLSDIKKITAVLLICIMLFSLGSCSNENDESGVRKNFVYTSKSIDIYSEDSDLQVFNVISYEDCFYAIVQSIALDNSDVSCFLYRFDSNGEKKSEVLIDSDINSYVTSDIVDGYLLYVTFSGKLEKMNIHTGEIEYSVNGGTDLCGVSSCEDGYVVLSVGKVDKYDKEDRLISSIENNEWGLFYGFRNFFIKNDKYYLLSFAGFSWKYYELNFDKSSSRLVFDTTKLEKTITGCSGAYVFNDEGEFLFDFEESYLYPLAIWNEMNLRPPQYNQTEPQYIGINDESFLQIYNYEGGFAQIVVYTYDATADYSDRINITVGGFNCSFDLPLNWAVYQYNTSQDEYRVVIEDYSVDFSWESIEEAAVKRAALIKYFNEGHTPDIYYGTYFDYDYFANNGVTLDMTPYMNEDFLRNLNDITPNIRELMLDSNGGCYSVFSGYQLEGYGSSLDVDSDMSIDRIIQTANDLDITLICNEKSVNLAKNAIEFSIYNDEINSAEDIEKILEYAYSYGIPDSSPLIPCDRTKTSVNDYLLWRTSAFGVIGMDDEINMCDEGFVFVGYPSIYESKHVIIPWGQVAVSAETLYPEACCDFVSLLLDEDVQDINNLSCLISVNDSCMRKMVDYCLDHSIIPEEEFAYRLYLRYYHQVSERAAKNYYEYVECADTIRHYDWGLINIIYEEVESYYISGKPIDQVAESLYSRIETYRSESN